MKLNISSESLTKVSNEVETFLNQRFPMTAPNKEGKDRKLFQATGRDIKHSAKLPKKVIAEEPSRKVVRTNIDALNALQNSVYNTGSKKLVAPINKSALGKVGSLKGPTSATIVKNSKGAPVESMKNVGPGKSFRNNKMAEYIKNNFFLKTNYKGAGKMNEPSPKASSKNKSSEGHSRSKALNQTDGNAGSQNWKSEEVISEADAFNMNLEDILYIEKRLNSIQEIIEKDFEIYDQVKEYVDIVQEQNYAVFFAPIKVAKLRDLVKNSMVLERWAMFFVFFYYFNQSLALENIEMLRQLVFLIHKNSLLYLRMYSQWIANSPALEVPSA